MKKGRKQLSIIIVLALVLSMMPIHAKAALAEIQEDTEWSGTITGQKYFTFTPEETGYYDITVSDSEEVTTYLTFYTSQDGERIRGLGEAFDGPGEGFYERNAVYLSGGVSYNVKVDCSDEGTEMTGYVSFTITKSQDAVYEVTETKQQITAISNGNRALRYIPQETGVYVFSLQKSTNEYIDINLYELVNGNLVNIEEQYKTTRATSFTTRYLLQEGKEYYFELYYSSDLDDGDEIPVYVQLSKGKNVSSISILELTFDETTCNSSSSFPYEEFLKLQINYTDGTSEPFEYSDSRDDFYGGDVVVEYVGEYDSEGYMKCGNQKVKVTYLGTFTDETTVYIKTKVESEQSVLNIDEIVTADVSRWYYDTRIITPQQNGYYTLSYYLDYGNFDECMEFWHWQIWDSKDNKILSEDDGFKLKAGETYYFSIILEGKNSDMTAFRYRLTLNEDHTHTFGDWIVTKQATVDSEGEKTRLCSSCGYQETETISKLSAPLPTPTTTPNIPKATETPIPITRTVTAPGSPKIASAKNNKKKTISLSWKKISGAAGYQIQYSTNKKFKKAKNKTTTKPKLAIKKLKAKKTYYFRVRTYVLDGNKKVYSKWSKIKKVKVKK